MKLLSIAGNIDPKNIKNQEAIDKLINYLERSKPYIPCYEARKQLGLRNSSNISVKKRTTQLVANRQKKNSMSWSELGSVALASFGALVKNGEYKNWFEIKTIQFKLVY